GWPARTGDGPGVLITRDREGAYGAQPQLTLAHGTLECGARRESGPRPIATLFGWREVEKGVERALPHTQRKGYVFIRHKRRHTQAVQGATALRTCPLGVPREALRHEEVSDRQVTAPRPL